MKYHYFLFTLIALLWGNKLFAHDIELKNADGITIYYLWTTSNYEKTLEVSYRGKNWFSYDDEYSGDVVIPESVEYNGSIYKVTSIGVNAFCENSNLTSVTIPTSITSIGGSAFYKCSDELVIKISVTNMSDFCNNNLTTKLIPHVKEVTLVNSNGDEIKEYIIPEGVTTIGDYAFYDCVGLTSVSIPNSVTSIGTCAFGNCSDLTSVTIGNGVKSIGIYAFDACKKLTTITIPNSVTSLGMSAFRDCSSLISVNLSNSLTSIEAETFQDCVNLSSIDIPNSVTTIETCAFANCTKLSSITIPNSVTTIDDQVFQSCGGLTSVNFLCSLSKNGKDIFRGCDNIKEVSLDCDKVPSELFIGKTRIEKVRFSEKVTSIGNRAFRNCERLTSITLPNSLTSLGREAFAYCRNLTSITVPSCLNDVGGGPFSNCNNVEKFNVTVTDYSDFCNNKILHEVQYLCYNQNPKRRDITLLDKDGNEIKEYIIPRGVTAIGDYAFYDCVGLTSVIIPDCVTSIGECAFSGCNALNSVTIPNSVTSIGKYAFEGCNGFNSLTIPNSVTSIGEYAFYETDIPEIISLINEPFAISYFTFSYNTQQSAVLYVPAGTIQKYKSTKGWDIFQNIAELNNGKYALSYIVDNEVYKTDSLEYGATITPEVDPTKEGYTFSGWSDIPETMPANDVTITGTFTINKYQISYIVDNEVYKTDSLEYGATITPEPAPIKEGYTFSDWSDIPETMPAKDVIVTGTFSINKYKLTYMVDNEVYKTDSLEYGAIITPEPEPTKEGYTFSGWCEIPETMPAKDVTVTGTFSINKYELTYMVDNEVYKTDSLEYGAIITPEAEPTKEGYTFSGWSDIPETMPANDVTVTGTFSINKYELTYMVDNEVYKTDSLEYCATITPEAEPTKEGYTFSGWSEIPETMPANDVIIRGTFTKKEDVNPDLYKGSPVVGKWMLTSNGYVHTHLELKSDGTFIYTSINDVNYEEHGKFKLEDDWLFQLFSDEDDWCKNKIQLLNPMSLIMQEYDGDNPKGKPDVYINTNPVPPSSIDKSIAGKWKLTTEDGYKHTHLELKEDGTFQYTSVNDPRYNEYGIFRVEGDIMYQRFSDEDDWCMNLILLNNPMSLALQEYNGIEVDDEIAGYIKENPEPPTETNPLLIGKWGITAQNGYRHTHAEFKSDGTFSYTSASDETYEEHGIFRVEDDILYQMFSDEDDWELSKIISLDGENLSLVELKNDGVNCYDEVDKYKKVSSGINSVTTRSEIQDIYSIEGIKNNGLRKGINIVKMKDGAKKKVLVK